MNKETLMLILVAFALAVHYVAQKQLLAKGWKEENPKPQINRLLMNGVTLIVFSFFAFYAFFVQQKYGLFGLLLFIEGAVCVAFARKLSKKKKK